MSSQIANNRVLVGAFANLYPAEFAAVLNRYNYEDIPALLDLLPSEDRVHVIAALFQPHATEYLANCTEDQLDSWFADADLRAVVRVWHNLEEDVRRKTISRVANRNRRLRIEELVHVAKDTVGSKLDPVFFWVHSQETVAEVSSLLKANDDYEGPILITDNADAVIGTVDPRRLVRSESSTPVHECLQPTRRLPVSTSIRNAINLPDWQTSRYLPIVDRMNRPLGLISREDLINSHPPTDSQRDPIENVLIDITQSMFDSVADLFKSLERSK